MFKFFRKYDKLILVIGAAFLMVAFLIQPTLEMFMTGQEDVVIGTVDGDEITVGDRFTAGRELQLLESLNEVLGRMATVIVGPEEDDAALKWLLMVEDARRMGLSYSQTQVDQVLAQLGLDPQTLVNEARRLGLNPGLLRQAIGHWIMLEQYQSLVLGREHVSPTDKLPILLQANQVFQQGRQSGDYQQTQQFMQQAQMLAAVAEGGPRLSKPLVQHFLFEQGATVSGQAVLIDSDRYLQDVPEPTEQELQQLFVDYRDDLPGQGKPHGFGYRTPTRVKLEYLVFPIQQLESAVTVEEVEALGYYEQNQEQFRSEAAQGQPSEVQPYSAVRSRVIEMLKAQKAEELAQRMAKSAQAMLASDARGLPEQNGYRQIPQNFSPTRLQTVADELAQEYGVAPEVRRLTDQWVGFDELPNHSEIAFSSVEGRPNISFAQYLQSARELDPSPENPLVPLRLQVGLPGLPLVSPFGGDRIVFRLTAAEADRVPDQLEEVREQVVQDARQLAAYEALLAERDAWVDRAQAQGLETLAQAEGIQQVEIPRIAPRRPGPAGQMVAPPIPGIGQSEELVERLFEVAEQASDRATAAMENVPPGQRIGVAGIDERLSLAIFRVDTYQPPTEQQLADQARLPYVASWINTSLVRPDQTDALSMSSVAQRVGFVPETDWELEQEEAQPADDAQPAPAEAGL